MTTTVSPPVRPAAVQACLSQSDRWIRGTRKSDGLPFFAIPSSTGEHIYFATASNCTCPDSNNRQRRCKHSLAVEQVEAAETRRLGLATPTEVDVAAAGIAADHAARAAAERRVSSASVPTHGARCLTDLAAQEALDAIEQKIRAERQAHNAAVFERLYGADAA